MNSRRLLLSMAWSLLAISPNQAVSQSCPFDRANDKSLSKHARDSISSAQLAERRAAPEVKELRVSVPMDATRASALVLNLFVSCGFPTGAGSTGIVEARFPRQMGWFAQFEIDARAYITPSDSFSVVRFAAVERRLDGPAINPNIMQIPIGSRNRGRSGDIWASFTAMADSLSKVPAAIVTTRRFVGSSLSRVFFDASCAAATALPDSVRVIFDSEADAKRAGYARSGTAGC